MDVLMKELFSTDIGLLSLFTIAFTLGMAVWLYVFLRKNMQKEEQKKS